MDRVRTGIEGLDQLLCGGFLRGDAVLVGGAPGTGKTSLGMQYLYNGITQEGEAGLLITFEEFPQRIYRDAANFGWDFKGLEEQGRLKVLFTSPEVLQQDITRESGLVSEMIAEIGARRVVVDSVSQFHDLAESPRAFREAVYGVVNALKRESLTAMLTRELAEGEQVGTGPEEFVADALIMLSRAYVGGQNRRFVEVRKSRGSPHIAIPSLFFVSSNGINVVPPFQEPFYRFEEAVSTGVRQLDDLLGGGIPYGAFYLIETDVYLHQDMFDVGFAREALETGDTYVRVAGQTDGSSRWRALMRKAGLEQRLQSGVESGKVVFVWGSEPAPCGGVLTPDAFVGRLEGVFSSANERALRMQVDVSRLLALMEPGQGCRALLDAVARCRGLQGVVLGTVSPRAVQPDELERLRATADGIVRVWTEGSYTYLQVVKTVNSARSPVYVVKQTPEPPFIEIIVQ